MNNRERIVMQQALEALDELWFARTAKTHEALAAIREALAEPVKQDPIDESWCIEPKPVNGLLVSEPVQQEQRLER